MRLPSPLALVAIACALVLVALTAWVVADPAGPWTGRLGELAPRRADGALTEGSLALSRATAPLGNALAAAAIAVALLAAYRWRDLVFLAAALGGTGILVWLGKAAIDAERPLEDPLGPHGGAAFPSAHASGWAALVTALALLVPRRRRPLVATAGGLLALAIGASRVHLGAHEPRDVVAGLALGVGWVAFAACVTRPASAQPPEIAPTTRSGSSPRATGAGSASSAGACERSRPQA